MPPLETTHAEPLMLKIWGRATSLNVQKVAWAAAVLGVPFERIDVGGAFGKLDTPEFAKLNPNRMIPVLQDGDVTLWESHAIVRYLADTYGRGTMASQDRRAYAVADQWMEWAQSTIQPDVNATCFIGLIRTPAATRNVAAIEAAAARAGTNLAILDAHLATQPYVGGMGLSMADIPVGTLMYRYFTLPIARPSLPHVEAWYARLQSHAAYRQHAMVDYAALKVAGA
jgi:glutathione S-transferase